MMAPLEEAGQVRPGNTIGLQKDAQQQSTFCKACPYLLKHDCKAFWALLLVSKHPSGLPSPDQLASLFATALPQLRFIYAAHLGEATII